MEASSREHRKGGGEEGGRRTAAPPTFSHAQKCRRLQLGPKYVFCHLLLRKLSNLLLFRLHFSVPILWCVTGTARSKNCCFCCSSCFYSSAVRPLFFIGVIFPLLPINCRNADSLENSLLHHHFLFPPKQFGAATSFGSPADAAVGDLIKSGEGHMDTTRIGPFYGTSSDSPPPLSSDAFCWFGPQTAMQHHHQGIWANALGKCPLNLPFSFSFFSSFRGDSHYSLSKQLGQYM